mmetsp:Transcript_35135/g.65551  ORF Transcript_35135/g.65551 Transcript_35135/m.65551 type:complete len:297 (-) Transcript_35135:124-1014(-)|eukprot:CAMPEP_0114430680 /NCGR_PEP_ID=MMETSP0103-20121206/10173_1 /TAXON_ID=37642 ORGANISM="Paraphysomonas imperforata, Strain PA2" /NCGR_SAMPLE_ID=MMETSP0103 /ASSEMBLY_ACC=CAM_ASM_000201 /LENGTH=296 /DNA_ID=CAMNT_0001600149 /DNA_START=93 /DNA_END=983 /DNA_ORIENTATION=-
MGRGKGKGKGRGGGKLFVANIEELQMREAQVQEAKQKRKNRRGDSDDEDDKDSDDDVDVEVDTKEDLRELANFERAARLHKASGTAVQKDTTQEDEEDQPRGGLLRGFKTANANHGSKNPKQMKTKDMLKNMENGSAPEPQLSRKEREALEAQRRKADYDRRHAAGETEEAKADLARLAEVRKRREEAKLKREKEEARQKLVEAGLPTGSDDESDSDDEGVAKPKISAEKKASNLAKKKAAASEDTSDDIPVLTSIEIKKLKPDMLKEHLKKRGLSLQGQKKELIVRLTEYEAARK